MSMPPPLPDYVGREGAFCIALSARELRDVKFFGTWNFVRSAARPSKSFSGAAMTAFRFMNALGNFSEFSSEFSWWYRRRSKSSHQVAGLSASRGAIERHNLDNSNCCE